MSDKLNMGHIRTDNFATDQLYMFSLFYIPWTCLLSSTQALLMSHVIHNICTYQYYTILTTKTVCNLFVLCNIFVNTRQIVWQQLQIY